MPLVISPWGTAKRHSAIRGSLGSFHSEPGAGDGLGGWGAGRTPPLPSGTPPPRLTSPLSTCSVSNKELSELIEQLQKNADQVERNIVDTEAKMQSVSARLPPGAPEMPAPWGPRA